MSLSGTISEINGDFGRKSHRNFSTCVYLTHPLREYCKGLALKKRKFEDMCIRLDRIPECDGQADGQNC